VLKAAQVALREVHVRERDRVDLLVLPVHGAQRQHGGGEHVDDQRGNGEQTHGGGEGHQEGGEVEGADVA